jgi:fatty-acid peroxygenase
MNRTPTIEATPRPTVPVLSESTLALLGKPYEMISATCRLRGTPLFETRLLLQKAVCMSGPEMAQLFYDDQLIQRRGAAPGRAQRTLFGKGGVQGLDDENHRRRKSMFMELLGPSQVDRLVKVGSDWWPQFAERWIGTSQVVLYDEMCELLCRTACQWAGVPLDENEVPQRTRELVAMFENADALGPTYWWATWMRRRSERWIGACIMRIRNHQAPTPENSRAGVVAAHRDLDGRLLTQHEAAVELINLLRPIVAISVFIVFAAMALHEHPECRDRLETDDDEYVEWFVQEVRRWYPFFPFVAGVVRKDFTWGSYQFVEGRRVLLDLYGTNRDSSVWDEPEEFRPERFAMVGDRPFGFIPQGGGDANQTHRCPGEPATIAIMKWAVKLLVRDVTYRVPPQKLRLQMNQLPALPADHFIIADVKWKT